MSKCFAVIMAGGKGERFWPLSTSRTPKQVLALSGEKPLIELAVDYLGDTVPPDQVLVITSADLVEPLAAALPHVPRANIIGEPVGRDTAAVCALAAAIIRKRAGDDAVFCILTADHIMGKLEFFRKSMRQAFDAAYKDDVLITIGIQPSHPATGFGYIEAGDTYDNKDGIEFFRAKRFVEKPDTSTAEKYVSDGNYFWNAGMFVWSVKSIMKALEKHRPVLCAMAHSLKKSVDTAQFDSALADAYAGLEKISIDYAVMENADNIVMLKGCFIWDDVGSWPALERHFPADGDGNTLIGECELLDSSSNIVYSKDRLTAMIGMHDVIIVQAEGVTLVCPRNRAQEVKALVQMLKKKDRYGAVL